MRAEQIARRRGIHRRVLPASDVDPGATVLDTRIDEARINGSEPTFRPVRSTAVRWARR